MRIAVLNLCAWLPEYQWDQAGAGELLAAWLARAVPEAEITVIDIQGGARLPDVAAFDGYVLSGSEKGVYDTAPWMAPLRTFLLGTRAAQVPVFGVCFGHQIMAEVFGGAVRKVGDPVVGTRAFRFEAGAVATIVWHQDQVTAVPPGARVLASAPYCPVGALAYGATAMSVQFHPEYSAQYVATFLRRGRGVVLGQEATDRALTQLAQSDVAPDVFAAEVGAFFREALGR